MYSRYSRTRILTVATLLGGALVLGSAAPATAGDMVGDRAGDRTSTQAGARPDSGSLGSTAGDAVLPVLDVLGGFSLNPFAHSSFNPLDNTVSTTGDLPLDSGVVTGPLADGSSLNELPGRLPLVDALLDR